MMYRGQSNLLAFKINDEPKVALFIGPAEEEGFLLVIVDGEKWTVQTNQAYKLKRRENVD